MRRTWRSSPGGSRAGQVDLPQDDGCLRLRQLRAQPLALRRWDRLSAMLDTRSGGFRLLVSTIGVDAWRRHRITPGTGGVDPALNCLLSLLDGLFVSLAMRPASGQFWDRHDKDAVARVPLQDHRIAGVLLA